MILLNEKLDNNISQLISLQYTLKDLINRLKLEFNSPRYKIILNVIENMFEQSAYYTSEKISDILDIIDKHRRLEEKFKIIIKGEQFKVIVFVIALPIILGVLGGLLPLLVAIMEYMEDFERLEKVQNFYELVSIMDIIIVFIVLFLCNIISTYYFLKIIHYERSNIIIVISEILFVLIFCITLLFSINIF